MFHFLLIDDDSINNFITERYIADLQPGSKVTGFNSARKALDYLTGIQNDQQQHPDFILLDISMPVMDGWDFLEEFENGKLQDTFSNSKIFMLSSSNNPGDEARAMSNPLVSELFMKPFDEKLLARVINYRKNENKFEDKTGESSGLLSA